HADLKTSAPAADSSIKTEIKEIRLNFSEAVNPKFSGIEVKDQTGNAVAIGIASINPKNKKELVVPLKAPLRVGTYTVEWYGVSEDAHRAKGHYSFKIEQ